MDHLTAIVRLSGCRRLPSKGRQPLHAGGKTQFLGNFDAAEEAAAAYDAASRELHGEFGRDNGSVVTRTLDSIRQAMGIRRKYRGSKSQYKGVHYAADRDRWRAVIRANGKNIHLGHFHTEIEAAQAYNEAARQYLGIDAPNKI